MIDSNVANMFDQYRSEFRISDDGVAYASIRGAARLAGVEPSSVLRHIQGVALSESSLSKTLAEHGFEGGAFCGSGIPDKAVMLILEYYAFDAGRYRTEQAQRWFRLFASVGARVFIQQALGWHEPQQEFPQVVEAIARLEQRIAALEGYTDGQPALEAWTDPVVEDELEPEPSPELQDSLDLLDLFNQTAVKTVETTSTKTLARFRITNPRVVDMIHRLAEIESERRGHPVPCNNALIAHLLETLPVKLASLKR